jgi:hypothetical protein
MGKMVVQFVSKTCVAGRLQKAVVVVVVAVVRWGWIPTCSMVALVLCLVLLGESKTGVREGGRGRKDGEGEREVGVQRCSAEQQAAAAAAVAAAATASVATKPGIRNCCFLVSNFRGEPKCRPHRKLVSVSFRRLNGRIWSFLVDEIALGYGISLKQRQKKM